MKVNIGYTTVQRDTQVWTVGDINSNLTTNTLERYNGSTWIPIAGNPNAIVRSIQTTRRTGGNTSGYYSDYTATLQLEYIGIDAPDVALKNTNSYVDTWVKLIAPPIANTATVVSSTGFTLNWALDTYWNGTSFVSQPITSYELTYSTSATFVSGNTIISNITASTYVLTGLIASTNYYYRVRVINGLESSSFSNTVIQATAAAPTQNEWLASYANNVYLNTSGNVPKQVNTISSINIGSTDVWAIFNIEASIPDTSDALMTLHDAVPTRRAFLRSTGSYQVNILITNDAAVTQNVVGTPTPMNLAGRILYVKSGTTVTVYRDNLSTIIGTMALTTATGTTTVTRFSVGQDQVGGGVWNGIIQKAAFFTGPLPATAGQMLSAI